MPNITEQRAMHKAKRYFTEQGYSCEDVSKKRDHKGYDLVVEKEGERLKIEVKGCTRRWQIPDPYVTEFDENRNLVADFLYVFYFVEGENTKLCAIPRDAISPEYVVPKQGYRISSRFKKEKVLAKFLKDV